VPCCAVLCCAVLCCAVLCCAVLCCCLQEGICMTLKPEFHFLEVAYPYVARSVCPLMLPWHMAQS
jgi:predicted unusual protein kinase regulating ubiquinone biosynthesis (AarF/ABC1/UbiB family)